MKLRAVFAFHLAAVYLTVPAAQIAVVDEADVPQTRFAASEIHRAAAVRGWQVADLKDGRVTQHDLRFLLVAGTNARDRTASALNISPAKSKLPQSYSIRKRVSGNQTTYIVLGADADGAMYGGLDLAEAIRLNTLAEIQDSDHAPFVEKRGIKFNIPLDARTPSYSDNSDAAQQNIPEMWSIEFWRDFLDEMARHRFNVLTLWNLHPFPSLVKVPEFPDVALDDVKRTTLKLDDSFSHSGSDMVRPAMLEHLETLKRMTIAEKIEFWRSVMRRAHDRGIEVYWFTWNIFTFGAEPKYGINPSPTNRTTIDYFRASVRETVLTYPLLAGFGITAGEQMPKGGYSKERWLWETYGEGIRDAKKQQPHRSIRLIHRFHMTGQSDILAEWNQYSDTLDLSFKYAIAHMYSVTNPPYIKPALPHLSPQLRTWLTVRNDDIYSFRWGDPEFARGFVRAMPGSDKMVGFYMGPDGYIWGREFLSTEPETPRQLIISKQWFSFMLWGRLSYEPDLPNTIFERTLAHRFPGVPSSKLLSTWAEASKIFPQITRFFWGDIDLRWFPEACLSHPRHRGWYTVRHFIEGVTMPESGIHNITQWRDRLLQQKPMSAQTPLDVADALNRYAQTALESVGELKRIQSESKEFRLALGDLEAMAHLGNYYAEKIRGACDLALFDSTKKSEHQQQAVNHLQTALSHWQRYASAYSRQYKPQLLNRVGFVDIPAFTTSVEQDIRIAQQWQPGTVKSVIDARQGDQPFRK